MRFPPLLRAAATLAAILALTAPRSAAAGETESRSMFAQGRELRLAGRCAEAIPHFRRALETYPEGLGSLRNVAECEEELGRFASARRSWWDLRLAALQTTASKYAGWAEEAEAAHARLGAKVGKVTVTFTGNRPEGIVVRFNGKPFDPRLVGVEIEQDNGPLEVSVAFGASPPLTKTVQVVTGGRHVVEFDLDTLPRPKPGDPPPAGARRESSGLTPVQVGGIVALGVGGAGLIGAGVALALRGSALSSVEEACPGYDAGARCPDSLADDVSRGETASVLVNVFAATAIVGAGVGVTLLVVGHDEGTPATGRTIPSAPRATIGVTPLPGGGFLGVQGSM